MFERIVERIKDLFYDMLKSRAFVLILVFCVLSAGLVNRIFYLQIVKGQDYLDNYKLRIMKTRSISGTRGNIYDRNGNLLAYNELAYSVTIEDNIAKMCIRDRFEAGDNFSVEDDQAVCRCQKETGNIYGIYRRSIRTK